MAMYWTDFSEDTLDAAPAGWTSNGWLAGELAVVADASRRCAQLHIRGAEPRRCISAERSGAGRAHTAGPRQAPVQCAALRW